mmetsp:Transcript_21740/g.24864  ORF Transcript_21740/g.24864 Transcript_21740/m.24864 type:complete len:95 (-) Transcript_21740:12-296(-)
MGGSSTSRPCASVIAVTCTMWLTYRRNGSIGGDSSGIDRMDMGGIGSSGTTTKIQQQTTDSPTKFWIIPHVKIGVGVYRLEWPKMTHIHVTDPE